MTSPLVCCGAGRSQIDRRTSARRSITGTPRRAVIRASVSAHPGLTPDLKQRPDTELGTSGIEVEPSRIRPEGAVTNQPRASPWDYEVKCASSPERAAKWYGVVSPFQGTRINVRTEPRAMPWASLFGPLQGKTRRARVLLALSPISTGILAVSRSVEF